MSIKTLVAPFALAVGLGFSGAAVAQTPVGTITVSDEDLPVVQQYCSSLQQAYDMEDGATIPDFDPTIEQELATQGVQLDSLSLDDCEEAGLLDDTFDSTVEDELIAD